MSEGSGEEWGARLARAQAVYVSKLWGGKFFMFDTTPRGQGVIMADQLAGHWYRRLAGRRGLLEREKVETSLRTVYKHNVLQFCGGKMGAVNGWVEGGGIDRSTVQSEEMWTGVSYGLASLMLAEGLVDEGMRTAEGVYRTVYETIGLGFETPEAIYEQKKYRSLGYMRPLAIWGMHIALKGRRGEGSSALPQPQEEEGGRKSSVLI